MYNIQINLNTQIINNKKTYNYLTTIFISQYKMKTMYKMRVNAQDNKDAVTSMEILIYAANILS